MENQPNFEFLCRVCAANTRGKNSAAECVYILKTPSLKDKIEKYLYFKISENDPLPKVLCKTCFRQVEATASLSKIAQHTQKVFHDFMVCSKPVAAAADFNISIEPNPASSSSAAVAATPSTSFVREQPMTAATIPADPTALSPATISCLDDLDRMAELSSKDEVVVNVSINDPLTRENSHKIIHASQKRQNAQESKFTPKSIAQRAFTSTPKTAASAGNLSFKASKKSSPAGVINFVNGQLQPQVTPLTSGNYIIGRKSGSSGVHGALADTSTNLLQQKRKNLKLALNNIRVSNALANTSGQVSLLKSSQKPTPQQQQAPQKQRAELSEAPKKATEAVVAQPSEAGTAQGKQTSVLVRQSKSKSPVGSTQRVSPQTTAAIHQNRHSVNQPPPPAAETTPPTPPQAVPTEAAPAVQPPGIPEDIVLGRVIRDVDLLKLILKALKWPLTKQTMDIQMQRLRNSRFLEIMSDPNLLQDMDLTQILGPYLSPVFLAAQAIQQQQWALSAAATAAKAATQPPVKPPADPAPAPTAESPASAAIPYKLPAETSVQLISVNPGGDEEPPTAAATPQTAKRDIRSGLPKCVFPKKTRKVTPSKNRDALIIISDEEANHEPRNSGTDAGGCQLRMSKTASTLNVDINPALLSEYGFCAAGDDDGANETLVALLNRQRATLSRLQRGHRQGLDSTAATSEADANHKQLLDMEDIVLMEERPPQAQNEQPPADKGPAKVATSDAENNVTTTQMVFAVPSQMSLPLITRPIIKRRKTVIQASPARAAVNTSTNSSAVSSEAAQLTAAATPTQLHIPNAFDAIPQTTHSSQVAAETMSLPTAALATANNKTYASTSTTSTTNVKAGLGLNAKKANVPAGKQGRKINPSKSALGQQLLEAVGLQKVDSHFEVQEPAPKQKRPKHEEPTVAHADSTTRSIIKEVIVEAKKQDLSSGCTDYDVEDQIDRITLVIQSNAEQQSPQSDLSTPFDKKLFGAARITNIRRLSTTATKNRRSTPIITEQKSAELSAMAEKEARLRGQTLAKLKENDRFYHDDDHTDAEDSQKVELSTSTTTTSSEASVVRRKRGRKRNAEVKDSDPDFDPDPSQKKELVSSFASDGRSRRKERAAAQVANQRVREIEHESTKKMEFEMASSGSSRPTRLSKTMSKYYKSPDRATSSKRSASSGGRGSKNRH